MKTKELYLKTLFCCCACDGEIAPEEISLIKSIVNSDNLFKGMNVETLLNGYVTKINQQGKSFLKAYLDELADSKLSDGEQMILVELAINMIEADEQVVYSEIKFFKKIRAKLSITDEAILNKLPDKEDYILPDILSDDKDDWANNIFAPITFS